MENEVRQHDKANPPNLFNPVALNVWREVYNGRWNALRGVQKAEFSIEIVSVVIFCGWLIWSGATTSMAGTVLVWGIVIVVLLSFFFLLTRSIR